jgi:hypothetical protein
MLHFLGPWQSFTVGSYRECGRDFVDVVLTPIYDLDSNLGNSRIRRTTQSWALAHGESIRRITGPHPTWVLIALVINLDDEVNDTDYLNLLFYEDYDYSGTWPQWLDSRLTPGRWLDYPALLCIAQAFDVAVLVVSVADGELDVYHLGDLDRTGKRVVMQSRTAIGGTLAAESSTERIAIARIGGLRLDSLILSLPLCWEACFDRIVPLLMLRPLLFNWWWAPMMLLMLMRSGAMMSLVRDLSPSSCCSVHLALAASQGSASLFIGAVHGWLELRWIIT